MSLAKRRKVSALFRKLCFVTTLLAILTLGVLVFHIAQEGLSWLDFDFLTNFPSRFPDKAGLKSALVGTVWVVGTTALFAVPIGVATATYLEEYAPSNRFYRAVQMNIANLAGMPSIVYGLLGLAVFVRFFGLGRSIWAGSMTLALLVLPVIIISARESIRAVPYSIREAAYGVGARKWHVVFFQVLPAALPGILTGVILSLSRVIGETAPLIMIGALSYVAFLPEGPHDSFTVLPVQIFNWASRPQEEFHGIAAAGIIVLLVVLFLFNFGAVWLRQKYQRYRL